MNYLTTALLIVGNAFLFSCKAKNPELLVLNSEQGVEELSEEEKTRAARIAAVASYAKLARSGRVGASNTIEAVWQDTLKTAEPLEIMFIAGKMLEGIEAQRGKDWRREVNRVFSQFLDHAKPNCQELGSCYETLLLIENFSLVAPERTLLLLQDLQKQDRRRTDVRIIDSADYDAMQSILEHLNESFIKYWIAKTKMHLLIRRDQGIPAHSVGSKFVKESLRQLRTEIDTEISVLAAVESQLKSEELFPGYDKDKQSFEDYYLSLEDEHIQKGIVRMLLGEISIEEVDVEALALDYINIWSSFNRILSLYSIAEVEIDRVIATDISSSNSSFKKLTQVWLDQLIEKVQAGQVTSAAALQGMALHLKHEATLWTLDIWLEGMKTINKLYLDETEDIGTFALFQGQIKNFRTRDYFSKTVDSASDRLRGMIVTFLQYFKVAPILQKTLYDSQDRLFLQSRSGDDESSVIRENKPELYSLLSKAKDFNKLFIEQQTMMELHGHEVKNDGVMFDEYRLLKEQMYTMGIWINCVAGSYYESSHSSIENLQRLQRTKYKITVENRQIDIGGCTNLSLGANYHERAKKMAFKIIEKEKSNLYHLKTTLPIVSTLFMFPASLLVAPVAKIVISGITTTMAKSAIKESLKTSLSQGTKARMKKFSSFVTGNKVGAGIVAYSRQNFGHALVNATLFAALQAPLTTIATNTLLESKNLFDGMWTNFKAATLHGSVIFFLLPVTQKFFGRYEARLNPWKGESLTGKIQKVKISQAMVHAKDKATSGAAQLAQQQLRELKTMRRGLSAKYLVLGTFFDGLIFTSLPFAEAYFASVQKYVKDGMPISYTTVYEKSDELARDTGLSFGLGGLFRVHGMRQMLKEFR